MPEETKEAVAEKPTPAKPSVSTIDVRALQKFEDWTLVQAVESGECRVVGAVLYGEHKVLPLAFAMPIADWNKATRPVKISEKLGLTGDFATEADIAVWRSGRVRDDQPISPNAIDRIKARLGRVIDQRIPDLQPKPKEE